GGCGSSTVCLGMTEVAYDVHAIDEWLERLKDFGELEAGALGRRRPLVHRRAVRNVDASQTRLRAGWCLCQWRRSRHHRFEKRQRNRDAHSVQERAPRQVLLADEHGLFSQASGLRVQTSRMPKAETALSPEARAPRPSPSYGKAHFRRRRERATTFGSRPERHAVRSHG